MLTNIGNGFFYIKIRSERGTFMGLKIMRKKVYFSLFLLVFSLSLFVFASYAYFTDMFTESFSGEVGFVDVDLQAYFEVVDQSTNSATSNDVSFTSSTKTIASVTINLSVYSSGSKIRILGSQDNDGYYTVVGTPTANALVVEETLNDESAIANVTIDNVTFARVQAQEVVIESEFQTTASDVSFTSSTNTISSTTINLAAYASGDTIRISGSNNNDGQYTVLGTPTANALVVEEDLVDEAAGATVTTDKNVTKPGVYFVNIVSSGNDFFFEDFRLVIDVYSNIDTYMRVTVYEQLTLIYTDYQGNITELTILFDGYMPFNYNTDTSAWYDNRINDSYLYYKAPVQRVDETTPLNIDVIMPFTPMGDFNTYAPGYSLQIAFSIEAVQSDQGPEEVWNLPTTPWGTNW